MSLTPFSMDRAGPCSLCNKRLGVEDCAIVFTSINTITIGSCCIGRFMSAVMQDYARMLIRHPWEFLVNGKRSDEIAAACSVIAKSTADWDFGEPHLRSVK